MIPLACCILALALLAAVLLAGLTHRRNARSAAEFSARLEAIRREQFTRELNSPR